MSIGHGLFFGGFVQGLRQGVKQRGADVASHSHALACTLEQLASQRGDGGFAIGTGDGQYLGVISHAGLQIAECLCKQGQLGAHPQASRHGGVPHGGDRLWAQTWALEHGTHVLTFDQARIKRAMHKLHSRQLRLQRRQMRWLFARVHDLHLRTVACAPTRHRQAGVTQAQNQHRLVVELLHRLISTSK